MTFDGATFIPELDEARLKSQLERVRVLMADGQFRTLRMIAHQASGTESSVSARLRDMRKPKFGGMTVLRRRVEGGNGLHEYAVLPTVTLSGQQIGLFQEET